MVWIGNREYFEPKPNHFVPRFINAIYVGGRPDDPPVEIGFEESWLIADRGVLSHVA